VATPYNRIAGGGLDRLSALSDGLFAIAMTLIVLEVRVPETADVHSEGDLIRALGDVAPDLLVYALSFLTLGIFWVGQGTQLRHLARADRHLLWLHLAFLAFVATMPFSTSLLTNFTSYRTALVVYWLNILLLGVTLFAAWAYAERAGLVSADAGPEVSAAIRRRIVVAQSLYAVGAALCVVSTGLAIAFIVAVQLNYAIAPRLPGLSRL
jgi:uncharacterized membrane protein